MPTPGSAPMLLPLLALVCWSLLVWLWMYVQRIPAMRAARIAPQSAKHKGALDGLPSRVRAAADNYNHLMEQPTLFYALLVYVHLAGQVDATALALAWGYVATRIAHTLVQTTINLVLLRFSLFVAGSLCLVALAGREVARLL